MRAKVLIIAVLFFAVTLSADDRTVLFDKGVDFSALKTFAVHDLKIDSIRPEIKNTLVAAQVTDAIRQVLTAKGLKEATDHPDFFIDASVTTRPVGRGGRPTARSGQGFAPGAFFEGTLIIDLVAGNPGKAVWHGVYRRPQGSAQKIAEKLPDDAKKLFGDYPPKKK